MSGLSLEEKEQKNRPPLLAITQSIRWGIPFIIQIQVNCSHTVPLETKMNPESGSTALIRRNLYSTQSESLCQFVCKKKRPSDEEWQLITELLLINNSSFSLRGEARTPNLGPLWVWANWSLPQEGKSERWFFFFLLNIWLTNWWHVKEGEADDDGEISTD